MSIKRRQEEKENVEHRSATRRNFQKISERPWPSHVQASFFDLSVLHALTKPRKFLANTNTKHQRPSRAKPCSLLGRRVRAPPDTSSHDSAMDKECDDHVT